MSNIYVFDMGNVIIKPSNFKLMYEKSKTDCEYTYFRNIFYHSKESEDVYSGKINDDTFFKIFKEKTNSQISVEEFKNIYIQSKGKAYSSTLSILKELRKDNNMICLLSNLKQLDYEYLKQEIDIKLFNKLFLSYMIHYAKPNPEIYEIVIKELGTNNFNFFDDSIANIESAKKLDINAYQVTGDNINECFTKNFLLRK